MINLELPPNLEQVRQGSRAMAESLFRPISRKYDKQEHDYPEELRVLGGPRRARTAEEIREAEALRELAKAREKQLEAEGKIRNGNNVQGVVSVAEMCWGDVALMLSVPGVGLGNAAISAVATPEQKERFGHCYASMAITEPTTGSDSANINTTARLEGDEWVINGEKIFITAGERCDTVVVWATLDKSAGKAAIKSFVVPKDAPGLDFVGLEEKLGLRASDTATIRFDNCRVPKDNILGSPEIKQGSFGGVMQTFDNTRPTVAAMAIGVARASLDLTAELLGKEGVEADYAKDVWHSSAIQAELYRMEADWDAARLLTIKAAWMSDNKQPNSMEASMCKAKAGRVGNYITLRCVELCQAMGYSEQELLEKWARDSKILDIFEGTQQIQLLIVARRLLGLSSAQLK